MPRRIGSCVRRHASEWNALRFGRRGRHRVSRCLRLWPLAAAGRPILVGQRARCRLSAQFGQPHIANPASCRAAAAALAEAGDRIVLGPAKTAAITSSGSRRRISICFKTSPGARPRLLRKPGCAQRRSVFQSLNSLPGTTSTTRSACVDYVVSWRPHQSPAQRDPIVHAPPLIASRDCVFLSCWLMRSFGRRRTLVAR